MAKRMQLTRPQSRANFSRGNGVKGINYAPMPMRGGIRL